MNKTTFTLAEAAALLNCHKETLRRAIKDGALRAARLGREYRISRLDMESFWTTQGGGELFGKDIAVERRPEIPPASERNTSEDKKEGKAPKPAATQQLTLLS